MVRPKKDAAKASTEDKTLSVPLSEYLKANNTVATALDVFHTMATSAMQGASHNLNCINACMASLQSSTQASLSANKLTIDAIDPEQYAAIIRILTMEKDSFNPMANVVNYQLPFAAPAAKPADVKVKREKKPKVPRDPNAPKRPLTAYLHYYHENRDLLKARLEKEIGPDVTKGQIQEEGKNVWNAMPDTDKEVYKAAYRAKWQVYQQELLDYQKKGGPVDPKLLAAVDPDAAPQADVEEDEDEEEAEEEEEDVPKVIEDVSSSEEEEEEEEEAEEEKPQTPPPSSKKSKAKAAPKASQKEESASSKKKAAAAAAAAPPADNTTTATPAKKSRKAAAPKEDAPAPETFSTKKRKANGQDAAPAAAKKSKKSKGDEEAAKAERRQKRKSGEYGDDY